MVLITGNTYPVRAELRALGGVWDARAQGWRVPEARADEARRLVADAPASSGPRRRRGGSSYTRFSSGAEVYRNARGRCEDAPCCGCCS
jgi:hypothetical protein